MDRASAQLILESFLSFQNGGNRTILDRVLLYQEADANPIKIADATRITEQLPELYFIGMASMMDHLTRWIPMRRIALKCDQWLMIHPDSSINE